MLQRDAETTLMELTAGLVDDQPIQRSAQKKRITVAAAKSAGFVEAGSGLFMSVADKQLGTTADQFWEVKSNGTGEPYLERMSYDGDQNTEDGDKGKAEEQKEASAECPQFFSTTAEMFEYFEEQGGSVASYGDGLYRAVAGDGSTVNYQDSNGSIERQGGHEEEMQRRADSGEEPPKRTLPEGVELDVSNKYREQGETRELSLSEQSDVAEVEEDLEKKNLSGLEFD